MTPLWRGVQRSCAAWVVPSPSAILPVPLAVGSKPRGQTGNLHDPDGQKDESRRHESITVLGDRRREAIVPSRESIERPTIPEVQEGIRRLVMLRPGRPLNRCLESLNGFRGASASATWSQTQFDHTADLAGSSAPWGPGRGKRKEGFHGS